ncbi:tumor necrosis factor ligand superfamily member 13B isoform X2 [Talpa occidentalis]|uniref:tumor necrosis factor ligand superfamily member 13B isoform X2 n=1 Tax=Talpa occidentalis TaxID=50954 RepID=UPI00188E8793|nr:tumor necrosis factor ligand superfamily member 13B isoform X2 [Talpa occidentalis]
MDDSTERKRARLSPCFENREAMKGQGVPILNQKESPSALLSPDGKLLAGTLLLALLSCCLTGVSFYQLAVLQAELGSLRAELQAPLADAQPEPPQAATAAPRATLTETPAVTPAQKGSLAPPSNASSGSRRKRTALGPEEAVIQDCLQLIADSGTPAIRKGPYTFVPWLLSFKRGTALEERENKILVKQTGYFFIYGAVHGRDLRHGPPDPEEEGPRLRGRAEPGDAVPLHPEHARRGAQQLLLLGGHRKAGRRR